MTSKTCFVIMPIGDQSYDGQNITAENLRKKYDDLIKEAITRARPNVEIVRADDVSLPGTITTDIITRIMHSSYIVADVTFPNPNVFYELGLRHACKSGTVIIRDKAGPKTPFDIAHLRHIQYENTPSGLKELAKQLAIYFDHADKDPTRPDNQFQELAKLTGYEFPNYVTREQLSPEVEILTGLMQSPDLLNLIMRQQAGEDINQIELITAVMANPLVAQPFLQALSNSGELSFLPKPKTSTKRRS